MTRPTPFERQRAEWMDVREMAAEARVSKMTIYRLIHERIIPSARIGRSIRVRRAHWQQYLQYAMHLDD